MEGLHGPSHQTDNQKSVTAPASDELRKDLHVNDDVEKRRKGAENFGKFTDVFERILLKKESDETFDQDEDMRDRNRKNILHAVMPEKVILGLQALFLHEKPMIRGLFSDSSRITRGQKEAVYQLLRNYGFEIQEDSVREDFIYDPKLIQEVIRRYPEVFGDIDVKESLRSEHREENDTRLGLLLGYPLEACQGYEKHGDFKVINTPQSLKIASEMQADAKKFNASQEDKNVYGFTFVPYNAGKETIALKERIKRAFHESGILKIWDITKK